MKSISYSIPAVFTQPLTHAGTHPEMKSSLSTEQFCQENQPQTEARRRGRTSQTYKLQNK